MWSIANVLGVSSKRNFLRRLVQMRRLLRRGYGFLFLGGDSRATINAVLVFLFFLITEDVPWTELVKLVLSSFAVVVSVSAAASGIWRYTKEKKSASQILLVIIAHGLIAIVLFALIQRQMGLSMNPNTPVPPPVALGTVIYFSVVTWTTLGYGDYAPVGYGRLFAAVQASLGYVFLGLVVGFTANLLRDNREFANRDGENAVEADARSPHSQKGDETVGPPV